MKYRRFYLPILLVFGNLVVLAHEGYRGQADQFRLQKIKDLNKNMERLSNRISQKRPGPTWIKIDPAAGEWEPAAPLNEIDNLTFKKMNEDGVPVNAACDDGTFLRRTSLLLTGRLPDPELTRGFLADNSPQKRAELIDNLLASEAFVTHWAFWFQEYFEAAGRLLRAGLPLYNEYFEDAVATGKSLDQMARELLTNFGLTDEVAEANFYARANEMARLGQDFWDNAAVHAGSKFLGMSLQCISCHDGAYHLEEVNLYLAEKQRSDLWGMAAFFSGINRRPGTRQDNVLLSFNIFQRPSEGYVAESTAGDRPVRAGGLVTPKYLFTGEAPPANKSFVESISDLIVQDRQFARNWANRFWGHLFGLAVVEPMDNFDLYRIDPDRELPEGWTHQALDLDLLEHMTDQMIAFRYDLRAYLRYVMNSATFQMSSEFAPGGWEESYAPYYTRYLARHMTSEMVYDSIVTATGVVTPMAQAAFGSGGDSVELVSYAHELMDVTLPRGRRQADIFQFLQGFGRGNRYDLPRSNQGNIGQALLLMNSSVIHQRLLSPNSRLIGYIQQGLPPETIVKELFLDIFTREPTAEESAHLLAELANFETVEEQVSSVLWLLINKVEFTFIY